MAERKDKGKKKELQIKNRRTGQNTEQIFNLPCAKCEENWKKCHIYSGCLVTKSCPTLVTPWTVACQAPLSMGFSRQEYWSGLPFPSAGDLPDPGIKPRSPALQAGSLPTELQGKPAIYIYTHTHTRTHTHTHTYTTESSFNNGT